MTTAEARERLEKIKLMARDDEAAHGEEDDFREDVLRAIRDGKAEDPAELAEVALLTSEIPFSRWCA